MSKLERLRAALAEAVKLKGTAEERIATLVIECRAMGMPWADIGQALGISRQAAWEQYKDAAADVEVNK